MNGQNIVFHGLLGEHALCGFSPHIPALWPNDHTSVRYDQIDNITCPECRAVAEKMQEQCYLVKE